MKILRSHNKKTTGQKIQNNSEIIIFKDEKNIYI